MQQRRPPCATPESRRAAAVAHTAAWTGRRGAHHTASPNVPVFVCLNVARQNIAAKKAATSPAAVRAQMAPHPDATNPAASAVRTRMHATNRRPSPVPIVPRRVTRDHSYTTTPRAHALIRRVQETTIAITVLVQHRPQIARDVAFLVVVLMPPQSTETATRQRRVE